MKNISVFASGNGSNFENIVKYFQNNSNVRISLLITNNKNAFVIKRCIHFKIPYIIISNETLNNKSILDIFKDNNIDFIVLAGFLLKIPELIINKYQRRIVNIHPALLPKYGGKGMYGMHIHKAVLENKEDFSGITIHYVNKKYDEGEIIFQVKCGIKEKDTPETLAERIHKLEAKYYPKVLNDLFLKIS